MHTDLHCILLNSTYTKWQRALRHDAPVQLRVFIIIETIQIQKDYILPHHAEQ